MKQVTAIIKPFKLDEVRESLASCGVTRSQKAAISPEVAKPRRCSALRP